VLRVEPIVQKLCEAQRGLLGAADLVPAEQWRVPPEEGRWSAGELVAHVMMVERAVLRNADRITQKEPEEWPFYRRFHLPLQLVERRWIRRKSPVAVDRERIGDKEEMLAEFREVRERTLAFLDETKARDLSAYRWQHPFIGTLNVYEWLRFVACHEIRHTKQMREIAAGLPKSVASLHN
jgi:uncharacterized damage-inducible protein DinB